MTNFKGLLLAIPAALLISIASPPNAEAQNSARPFGLGLTLGYPDVGLSAQYFMSAGTSLQFALSFWYRDGRFGSRYNGYSSSGLFLRADYLFHPAVLIDGAEANLGCYVGPGLFAGFGDSSNVAIGAEVPIGLAVTLDSTPIDFALELVPRLGIVDPNGARLNFGVGGAFHVRYYF